MLFFSQTAARQFLRCANIDFADVVAVVGGMADYSDAPAMNIGCSPRLACVRARARSLRACARNAGNLISIRANQTFGGVDYKCISVGTMVAQQIELFCGGGVSPFIAHVVLASQVHELTHVWQTQNAPLSLRDFFWLWQQQTTNRSGVNNVYNYGNLTGWRVAGRDDLLAFNVEQQAEIVEHAFERRPRNDSALYYYAKRVIFERCVFQL